MAASSSERLPLRRLQPAPLPVDLDVKRANLARKSQQLDDHARHKLDLLSEMPTQELQRHKSPYRQHLRRPKSPAPSPGSPAQRAAKSILKIKEGLLRLDATKWILDDEETANTLPRERLTPSSPSAESAHNLSSKTTSLGNSRARSQSPARAKTPQRSPSRKKKKRPPTREERELAEKQARLAEWLKANPDVSPANIIQGDGRWTSRVDGTPFDTTSPYSTEVEARIEAAMRCQGPLESGVRLWDDPVRSLIAAEMTSESVFGGLVPTRALAFKPPQPSSPSRLLLAANEEAPLQPLQALTSAQTHNNEENREQMPEAAATSVNELEMSDLAQKVFTLANRQAADGAVADALATLEAGIHRSLSISQARLDAVSCSDGAGFDYSAQAHDSATKLQIFCRVRLRRRRCAHAQLVSLLAHVSAVELGRRAREDEFVAANLAQAKLLFRTFLSSTKPGRKLVHWQAEKPWIRFRRLRHNTRQWEQLPLPERLNAVVGVLSGCIFRGLARRALCQMLVGRNEQVPAFPKELKVSTEALSFLATPPVCLHTPKLFIPVGCCACCPWWSSVRDKLRVVHGKLSRRAATMWWKIVTFPKEHLQPTQGVSDACDPAGDLYSQRQFKRCDSAGTRRLCTKKPRRQQGLAPVDADRRASARAMERSYRVDGGGELECVAARIDTRESLGPPRRTARSADRRGPVETRLESLATSSRPVSQVPTATSASDWDRIGINASRLEADGGDRCQVGRAAATSKTPRAQPHLKGGRAYAAVSRGSSRAACRDVKCRLHCPSVTSMATILVALVQAG
ncbi:unnamed protein product [Phytophthora lilii]|uniref:Unnamed protein product n=1 Tax=Phytophthora lilii TaxID=2077276 RepID=A0A9W7D7U3_9STRA|nr:unnamed protein product [Phytophthora lilii]